MQCWILIGKRRWEYRAHWRALDSASGFLFNNVLCIEVEPELRKMKHGGAGQGRARQFDGRGHDTRSCAPRHGLLWMALVDYFWENIVHTARLVYAGIFQGNENCMACLQTIFKALAELYALI